MADIVEWLRDKSSEHNMYRCDDAADEIVRLRAKLKEIYDLHHNDDDIFIRDDVTYEIVCEALEKK